MTESIELFQTYHQVLLTDIHENYAQLRLIDPKAEAQIQKSLYKYGQISPVVVGQALEGRYEMIDGFKRLRACRQLGHQHIKITVFKAGQHALKAAMISLNWRPKSIIDLEEAMVIQSLCREDCLNQTEVAVLLGRHKSWVCRRLSLAERLSEEILDNIKLGLINITTARELAKLPRGNQADAVKTIMKYSLTSRETASLVSRLLQEPRWNHQSILRYPEHILENRHPDRPRRKKDQEESNIIDKMMASNRHFLSLEKLLDAKFTPDLTEKDRDLILSVFNRIEQTLIKIKTTLHQYNF
jgi:ParB/RepB/Spo0J family partition protein